MAQPGLIRIGELARRTGMAEATLRAWERRYGIPVPRRTSGGHRLYADDDVRHVLRVQRLVDEGWSVHAAAAKVREEAQSELRPSEAPTQLAEAIDALDPGRFHRSFDAVVLTSDVRSLLDEVVEPLAHRFEDGIDPWVDARHRLGLALLADRLQRLLDERQGGTRGVAVAAVPQGESADVGALVAAVALADAGWDVRFFGADVPPATLAAAAEQLGADLVVVAAARRDSAEGFVSSWNPPAGARTLLAGAGFEQRHADPAREVEVLPSDVTLTQALGELATTS